MIASKIAPAEDDYEKHILSLNLESIRAIASLRHPDQDLSEDYIPSKMIQIAIRTLQSDSVTPEEQAMGFFTRKKLRKLLLGRNGKKENSSSSINSMSKKYMGNQ